MRKTMPTIETITAALTKLNRGKSTKIEFVRERGYYVARAYVDGIRYGYFSKVKLPQATHAKELLKFVTRDIKEGKTK